MSASMLRKWAAPVAILAIPVLSVPEPPYQLHEAYVGADFFSKWDFFTQPDPSNGHVEYLDRAAAMAEGLTRAAPGSVHLSVDRKSQTSSTMKRHSVRLQSKATFNGGLFVIDVEHMPAGCGTWPAFWMYGEDPAHVWPAWGEYDIIESFNKRDRILTTLHTSAGCEQSQVGAGADFSQRWEETGSGAPSKDCNVKAEGQFFNQGCSQTGPPGSAGQAFNARGGGTFAGEWDPEAGHIRTWFWAAGQAPRDILLRRPVPDSWGLPASTFKLSPGSCSPSHFQNMRLVIDANLCGDLAAPNYANDCPAEAAMAATCEEYVSDPLHVAEAFWSIRGLDVYMKTGTDMPFMVIADHPEQNNRLAVLRKVAVLALLVGFFGIVFVLGVCLFQQCFMTDVRGPCRGLWSQPCLAPGSPRGTGPSMPPWSGNWGHHEDQKRRARSLSTESGGGSEFSQLQSSYSY